MATKLNIQYDIDERAWEITLTVHHVIGLMAGMAPSVERRGGPYKSHAEAEVAMPEVAAKLAESLNDPRTKYSF